MESTGNGGWEENRKMVLYRLGTIDDRLGGIDERLASIDRHLTGLSVRASVWGGLAGLLVSAILVAIMRRLIG